MHLSIKYSWSEWYIHSVVQYHKGYRQILPYLMWESFRQPICIVAFAIEICSCSLWWSETKFWKLVIFLSFLIYNKNFKFFVSSIIISIKKPRKTQNKNGNFLQLWNTLKIFFNTNPTRNQTWNSINILTVNVYTKMHVIEQQIYFFSCIQQIW